MERYRDQRNGSAVPGEALLAAARQTHDSLAGHLSLFPHSDRVHYVAGTSPRTVTGVEIVDGRVVLQCTTEGDGRVTYESGRLPGVRTWYMEAVHGDLASHEPGFRALQELLETGTTSRLSTAPPSTARGGAVDVPGAARAGALSDGIVAGGRHARQDSHAGRTSKASSRASGYRWSTAICATRAIQSWSGTTRVTPSSARRRSVDAAAARRAVAALFARSLSRRVRLVGGDPAQAHRGAEGAAPAFGCDRHGPGQMGRTQRRATERPSSPRRAPIRARAPRRPAPRRRMTERHAEKVGLSVLLIGGNSTTNIAVGDSVGAILRAIAQANRELADGSGERLDHPGGRDHRAVRRHGDRGRSCGQASRSADRQGARHDHRRALRCFSAVARGAGA